METDPERSQKRTKRKRLLSESREASSVFNKVSKSSKVVGTHGFSLDADSDSDLGNSIPSHLPIPPLLATPPSLNGNGSTECQPTANYEASTFGKGTGAKRAASKEYGPIAQCTTPTPSQITARNMASCKENLPIAQCVTPTSSRFTDITNASSNNFNTLAARKLLLSPPGTADLELILVSLHKILERVETVVSNMLDLQADVRLLKSSANLDDKDGDELPEGVRLPLQNEEELDNFNDLIKLQNKEAKLIQHLSLIGGLTVKAATYSILKHLISLSMALKFTWTGSGKNKKAFQSLPICGIVLKSLRKNPLFKKTTREEYRVAVQEFFRTAANRDWGQEKEGRK